MIGLPLIYKRYIMIFFYDKLRLVVIIYLEMLSVIRYCVLPLAFI